jgi:hypothetical protein
MLNIRLLLQRNPSKTARTITKHTPELSGVRQDELAEAIYSLPEARIVGEALTALLSRPSGVFTAADLKDFAQSIGCENEAKCNTKGEAAESVAATCANGLRYLEDFFFVFNTRYVLCSLTFIHLIHLIL